MNGATLTLLTCLVFAWYVIYQQSQTIKRHDIDSELGAASYDYYMTELQRSSDIIRQLSDTNTALLLAQAECRCADRASRKQSLTVVGRESK